MARRLIVLPDAETDIADAHEWYDQHRPGLGAEFIQCIDDVFSRVQQDPASFPEVLPRVRRALVKRFPFIVCYTHASDEIIILAVMHAFRDPRTMHDRLSG